MSSSKMRQVKKSLKQGAHIECTRDETKVRAFYDILSQLYRTKVKKPLPSQEFFMNFARQQLGDYLLITLDDIVIGGIMCPRLDDRVLYEWFVCGKDGVYNGVYPSVLATWAAMDFACSNGIRMFDFMGAGKPDQDYGVREFKSKFGGELVQHGRFKKIHQPLLYRIGVLGIKMMSLIS